MAEARDAPAGSGPKQEDANRDDPTPRLHSRLRTEPYPSRLAGGESMPEAKYRTLMIDPPPRVVGYGD
jgi:hypothetical protein